MNRFLKVQSTGQTPRGLYRLYHLSLRFHLQVAKVEVVQQLSPTEGKHYYNNKMVRIHKKKDLKENYLSHNIPLISLPFPEFMNSIICQS